MKLIISDIPTDFIKQSDNKIILNRTDIHNCIGCFGCWIKTPGRCIIKDSYQDMGKYLNQCDELIFISRCVYGGFSPYVKNVFDRSISYMLPYFCKRYGRMHHKRRYKNNIKLSAYFYGDNITNEEKETAISLVKANAINFYAEVVNVDFYNSENDIRSIAL